MDHRDLLVTFFCFWWAIGWLSMLGTLDGKHNAKDRFICWMGSAFFADMLVRLIFN